MVKLIWVCAALMAMFVTGESLTCRTCKLSIADKCLYSGVVTCSDTQPNCFWGKLALNISHIMTLQTRGCMASSLCNKTEMGALLTAGYTFTTTCCSTDCCNGATSIQLPVTAALGVTLMAVWNNCIL
ncbi:sperm acrosome membrane-associated protein 4-like [Plectropomus leopardus]|uniref:sperm acrosome membrane-associated protein 4-like n=1 Tax=Plectropomus leopardus TaxID=160734 RepID=UPI001C4DA0D1|nr:sperm acrosome membrane-associated protein 4-like [Plectropomus leopardus]